MIVTRYGVPGEMLLEQLPWLPRGVRRVVIDIPIDGVAMIYIEQVADFDELNVNALANLTGGEVVTISPKAAGAQPARKAPDTSSKTDKLK